jgi:hypothetical protein
MNKGIPSQDLFLAVLALLLISVSFYQTWVGLEQIFGPASFIIALVLSLLLLFLCLLMRNAKLDKKPTSSLVWIYIAIASFCFIANFNALYTRFMRTDIYTSELREINNRFSNLETDIQSKFNYKYDKKTAQNIETIKKQMMEQIKDPANTGIGTRAQSLIRDIERLTGQRVDFLTPMGNDYDDLATRMGAQIDNMISDLSPDEKSLNTDIHYAVLKWNKNIQEFLVSSKKDQDEHAQGLIDGSLTEYNKLGNRANAVLGEDKFKFKPALSKTQEVGKIGFAFDHALKNFGMYQFVVLAGCILLDFIIVIIIHVLPTSKRRSPNDGYSQYEGHTL